MSKAQDDAILRMLEAAQAVIKNSFDIHKMGDTDGRGENIIAQLLSDKGYSPAPLYEPPPGADALTAAMQLMSAYYVAENFAKECVAIVRIKSLSTETKAEWTRGLAWHFTYVLRERCRIFVNVLIEYAKTNPSVAAKVSDLARTFKKTTDKFFTTRSKHVHRFEIEDPLVSQIKLIELLASSSDEGIWHALKAVRQPEVKKHIRKSAEDNIAGMLAAANALVADSEEVWRIIFAAMAEDKSPRKKRQR